MMASIPKLSSLPKYVLGAQGTRLVSHSVWGRTVPCNIRSHPAVGVPRNRVVRSQMPHVLKIASGLYVRWFRLYISLWRLQVFKTGSTAGGYELNMLSINSTSGALSLPSASQTHDPGKTSESEEGNILYDAPLCTSRDKSHVYVVYPIENVSLWMAGEKSGHGVIYYHGGGDNDIVLLPRNKLSSCGC